VGVSALLTASGARDLGHHATAISGTAASPMPTAPRLWVITSDTSRRAQMAMPAARRVARHVRHSAKIHDAPTPSMMAT